MVLKKFILDYWPYMLLLALSTLIIWPLFLPGYFSHHDDLQVMRIFEMRVCLKDFQIPCRWVPDMGYGNGYPLFNYYNVFPYYLGAITSFALGFLGSAKLLFLIVLILAPFSMYLLAKELLGFYPALFAAVLYMFAPYRALDIYVRGAIAESFAIAVIPLIFYFGLKLSKENYTKDLLGLIFSTAVFLTSHTIAAILFAPVLAILFANLLWGKEWIRIKPILLAFSLGLGLSAFFILPAFFEKNLVQIDNLTKLDLDFRAHFVTLSQLFLDRSWGYGASFLGSGDTISFQIGWPHWVVVVLSIPALLILLKDKRKFFLGVSLLIIFLFSVLMTHNRSAFIWESIGTLRFTQFPWRFLSVTIFTASLLGGFLVYYLMILSSSSFFKKLLVGLLLAVTVILNWSYFRPNEFYFNLTDQEKLSGSLWEVQQKASILDYLPVGAREPIEPAPDKPLIKAGNAKINKFEKKSNSWKLDIDVKSAAVVEIPVMDFPNWKVYEKGIEIKHSNDNYVKRISINLPAGAHSIFGKLTNTPIRTVSNIISFLSLLMIGYLIFYGKAGKIFR